MAHRVNTYTFEGRKHVERKGFDKKLIDRILSRLIKNFSHSYTATFEEDRQGVDLWAVRDNGEKIGIDLKYRSSNQNNKLPLETWSVIEDNRNRGIVGWTRDTNKLTDIVVWYWADGHYAAFPFKPLCEWFSSNWQNCLSNYHSSIQCSTKNDLTWYSQCVFVPVQEVASNVGLDVQKISGNVIDETSRYFF